MENPQVVAHEALDRVHMVQDMFDRHILEHTFIESDPELKAKAEEAFDKIHDLYVSIGQKFPV